jgi:hypothetical protein
MGFDETGELAPKNGHDQNEDQRQNENQASHDEKRRAEPTETNPLQPIDEGVQKIAERAACGERQKHTAKQPEQQGE